MASKEASVVGKDDALKAQRIAARGARKVHGDLMNSGKPCMTEASQKQLSVVDESKIEGIGRCGGSRIVHNASIEKETKMQIRSRKTLRDFGKSFVKPGHQKKHRKKSSVVSEESLSPGASVVEKGDAFIAQRKGRLAGRKEQHGDSSKTHNNEPSVVTGEPLCGAIAEEGNPRTHKDPETSSDEEVVYDEEKSKRSLLALIQAYKEDNERAECRHWNEFGVARCPHDLSDTSSDDELPLHKPKVDTSWVKDTDWDMLYFKPAKSK